MLIDLHHHLVFGVDDGASDEEAALAMLRAAAAQNIEGIVCTSHDSPGEHDLNMARYKRNLALLRETAEREQIGVRLFRGSEILYSPDTVAALREGSVLTLAGSSFVLIEFYPDFPWQLLRQAAEEVKKAGYRMVLAHAERYQCLRDIDRVTCLKQDCGVLIQINADTVLHSRHPLQGRWTRRVLESRLADIVASDAHHPLHRLCRLGDAHDFLMKQYGREYAYQLCRDHPLAIIKC